MVVLLFTFNIVYAVCKPGETNAVACSSFCSNCPSSGQHTFSSYNIDMMGHKCVCKNTFTGGTWWTHCGIGLNPWTCKQACYPKTCSDFGCGVHYDGCSKNINCGPCCTSHADDSCYNNDVYWYDSCGVREDKKQECSHCTNCDCTGWSYYCSGEDVWRTQDCHNRGCSVDSCTDTIVTLNEKYSECNDCVECNCEGFGPNYCKNGDLYHNQTCYNQGCSGTSCYSNPTVVEALVEDCIVDCVDNACLNYIDIGLRIYDGTQTVVIAAEPLGTVTSALRIAKGATIYGLVLVDVGDAFASRVRINTASGIMALRKL